ncbi:DUF4402 domain-containing protein [Alterisphingorhabdus coralli]|uniref:DUF4402 domain-containing protein n=1 Tax=Alterisphingorhabdus coralli TaxID=3071408 RepID=A0AA97HZV2_9SPHN|nr:DUF4402 domain-containing protein [Parasphingorhabdus sp. SCSIO 66989]WOE75139.1 DUF4402 domain-containing protein [Parasphingorhabdus sp. SCSIO 66989]
MRPETRKPQKAACWISALLCGAGLMVSPALAQEEARADATIRTALTIENVQGLDFGRIIPGTGNSRIRINPNNGNLTIRGNAVAAGGTPDRARFSISGSANQRVRISLVQRRVTLTREGGSETMRLNRFRLDGRRNRRLDDSGNLDFAVGGQLRVRRNQAAGVYRGTFNVTVDYF